MNISNCSQFYNSFSFAHARSKGKAHGRPATAKEYENEISSLFKNGLSQSEIAALIAVVAKGRATLLFADLNI